MFLFIAIPFKILLQTSLNTGEHQTIRLMSFLVVHSDDANIEKTSMLLEQWNMQKRINQFHATGLSESNRKLLVFWCLLGIWKETWGTKFVNASSWNKADSKKTNVFYTFNLLSLTLRLKLFFFGNHFTSR